VLQRAGARSPQVSAAPRPVAERRRQIAERAVRPFGVVVAPPFIEFDPRPGERGEQRLVQELPRVVVDYRQDPEPATIAQRVVEKSIDQRWFGPAPASGEPGCTETVIA
jgi:hypothetical protein